MEHCTLLDYCNGSLWLVNHSVTLSSKNLKSRWGMSEWMIAPNTTTSSRGVNYEASLTGTGFLCLNRPRQNLKPQSEINGTTMMVVNLLCYPRFSSSGSVCALIKRGVWCQLALQPQKMDSSCAVCFHIWRIEKNILQQKATLLL